MPTKAPYGTFAVVDTIDRLGDLAVEQAPPSIQLEVKGIEQVVEKESERVCGVPKKTAHAVAIVVALLVVTVTCALSLGR
jgi:hypothetical protein